jgi:deazaflavin-dependent oxidoreductase (nitroreductase family)
MTATIDARPKHDPDLDIIDEFRSNDGKVGGWFTGAPLLLLHNVGAKSGTERIAPLMYKQVGDDVAVFASKGGADDNPDWYYNVLANPMTRIEVGSEVVAVRAREAQGDERIAIWNDQVAAYPTFGQYAAKTSREYIPVVVLERI